MRDMSQALGDSRDEAAPSDEAMLRGEPGETLIVFK